MLVVFSRIGGRWDVPRNAFSYQKLAVSSKLAISSRGIVHARTGEEAGMYG